MIKTIKKYLQKIKCSIPFNFTYFGHKNLKHIKALSNNCQMIKCIDCGRLFAINHDVSVVLPWEDVKSFYDEFEYLFTEPANEPDPA